MALFPLMNSIQIEDFSLISVSWETRAPGSISRLSRWYFEGGETLRRWCCQSIPTPIPSGSDLGNNTAPPRRRAAPLLLLVRRLTTNIASAFTKLYRIGDRPHSLLPMLQPLIRRLEYRHKYQVPFLRPSQSTSFFPNLLQPPPHLHSGQQRGLPNPPFRRRLHEYPE